MDAFLWFLTKLTENNVIHRKIVDTKSHSSVRFSDSFTGLNDMNLTILTFVVFGLSL